ncbi:hypothetical protein DFH06DRAFT_1246057 [Mycena polygramma]|nr:hypothetical protein DFH06DRAFT_1246057 [Mycena polygramma]
MAVPAVPTLSPRAKCSEAVNPGPMYALLEENVTLRETCETLKEEVTSSTAAVVKAKAKYKEVKKEKLALQQTCRELIELVEKLQDEAKADADSSETVDDDTTGDSEPSSKQEPQLDTLPTHTVATAKPPKTYEEYMAALPTPTIKLRRAVPAKLAPVFTSAEDLYYYFSDTPSLAYPACLLQRTKPMPGGHFVAFASSHSFDHTLGVWTKGSDLADFYGSSREVFMDFEGKIGYMGTFNCIALTDCQPGKTANASKGMLRRLAFDGSPPSNHAALIRQCYPTGVIAVEAMGLQLVGFNHGLYNTLRRAYARGNGGKKRKCEDELERATRCKRVRL